jgi:hypothetical protein
VCPLCGGPLSGDPNNDDHESDYWCGGCGMYRYRHAYGSHFEEVAGMVWHWSWRETPAEWQARREDIEGHARRARKRLGGRARH